MEYSHPVVSVFTLHSRTTAISCKLQEGCNPMPRLSSRGMWIIKWDGYETRHLVVDTDVDLTAVQRLDHEPPWCLGVGWVFPSKYQAPRLGGTSQTNNVFLMFKFKLSLFRTL
ncbi:hypothetical protein ABZP36_015425 [Zizania latifolia]